MRNENWTPGPWKAHETKTRCVTFEGEWGEENLFLKDADGYYSCQSEADARLIAAAPSMYAMLKRASEAARHNGIHGLAEDIDQLLSAARGE